MLLIRAHSGQLTCLQTPKRGLKHSLKPLQELAPEGTKMAQWTKYIWQKAGAELPAARQVGNSSATGDRQGGDCALLSWERES